jgi:C4-type Zn-finger protein
MISCWQSSPCDVHRSHPIDEKELDSGDDLSDVENDLSFLRTVKLDEFNVRLEAGPEVMDCVNRHFDSCNQSGSTELTEIDPCADCEGPRYLAQCEIPTRGSIPKLSLFSSSCPHCKSQQVKVSVGEASSSHKAMRMAVSVSRLADLERDVVKSEFARVEIPEMGLELSQGTLGGRYTTIRGLIDAIVEDISNSSLGFSGSQGKLDAYLENLQNLTEANEPLTLIILDEKGRSFVGGP